MVQFNLLPDIKLEFVKARRMKYLMTMLSFVTGCASIAIFLFAFFFVNVVQKDTLRDIQKDIDKNRLDLRSIPNLSKILTVQNQLGALTALHESKPVSSRIFGYLSQLTPAQVNLDKLTVEFSEAGKMTIGGTAPNLDSVYVYTDTLKATRYRVTDYVNREKTSDICVNVSGEQLEVPKTLSMNEKGGCISPGRAFTNVVLDRFGRDEKGATFTVTVSYNPDIFNDLKTIALIVPSGVQTNQANLFEADNS